MVLQLRVIVLIGIAAGTEARCDGWCEGNTSPDKCSWGGCVACSFCTPSPPAAPLSSSPPPSPPPPLGDAELVITAGTQTGFFQTHTDIGSMNPHDYPPNEFVTNDFIYEGLLAWDGERRGNGQQHHGVTRTR